MGIHLPLNGCRVGLVYAQAAEGGQHGDHGDHSAKGSPADSLPPKRRIRSADLVADIGEGHFRILITITAFTNIAVMANAGGGGWGIHDNNAFWV